jgi:hypothetical protein
MKIKSKRNIVKADQIADVSTVSGNFYLGVSAGRSG